MPLEPNIYRAEIGFDDDLALLVEVLQLLDSQLDKIAGQAGDPDATTSPTSTRGLTTSSASASSHARRTCTRDPDGLHAKRLRRSTEDRYIPAADRSPAS